MFRYEVIKSLNELEMLVYDYIMKNQQTVGYMTVRELADAVHVSTSTVMRFCKKAGFDGYSEFKVKFKMYVEQEKRHQNVEDLLEMQEYFEKVGTETFQKAIYEAADIVRAAKQVIFIGLGTSGILGKYGARYFSNLGKFSQYIEDPYFPVLGGVEDLVVIALSVSGETEQVIEMVNRFKQNNCKIISITNRNSTTLAKISDFNLSYYVMESDIGNHVNMTTQVPVIYLIEAIGRRL
ncbi:MAG: MurR/RpiR family transcriptional regulator [Faecalicatena sp.]|uniref:MurR/RpiR family transcriptional regulator n=1 Tax=Faecalicatena sp. TaxID=2005360 RepID=UPI002582FEE8|nr:MurR/RpiR family transcriptional regulator [Faecalicatena sp.]MCI6465078.1 MurR/RpiR family transcriptional regulator [Faecalicatena sp.]MDY5617091.1 MurR/RpiR family transcriptional regulator [Lachnospiraceae bacterium]